MKRLGTLVVILIIVGAFIMFWWENGKKPVNPSDTKEKIFVIQKGLAVREVANELKQHGFIRDPIVFFLFIKQQGKDKDIQAGDFRLSPSMSLEIIVNNLTHGTLDIWVTFPEGLRGEEIASIVKDNFSSYNATWEASFVENTGYLFPDTYLIPKDSDQEQIISIMRNNFNDKITKAGVRKNGKLQEIVILASLIEREAKTDDEKPIIAGILTNRLEDGMPLQVDATVQYAKGYANDDSKRWWGIVTSSDYKNIESAYNTYLHPGLTPSPISNPGLAAIVASANPPKTPYYYYLHDKEGKIHYARTIDEHNRNVKEYIKQ